MHRFKMLIRWELKQVLVISESVTEFLFIFIKIMLENAHNDPIGWSGPLLSTRINVNLMDKYSCAR